ncbi:MAG: hypothetical protein ACXWIG_04505, partial [Caldimonas sp.]
MRPHLVFDRARPGLSKSLVGAPGSRHATFEIDPVVARMVLVDEAVAVDLGVRSLGASGAGVVYVDRAVREPGDVVVGPRTFALTRPAVMVFRDEMPG